MLGLTFSSKLDWGSCIISIAKTASKKIGALIRSMKFLSPEAALYLYKSTIRPCMEYCFHVWAGALSCYLELLDNLQKRICKTIGPSLATSLEPLAHRQNVASLSLFYRYYFGCGQVCLLSYQINWFINEQHHWKEPISISDFLHGGTYLGKVASKAISFGQVRPGMLLV